MKTYLKIIPLAVAIVLLNAANSFASADYYLQIKGKSTTKIVKLDCPAGGECTASFDDLPAGKYTMTLCDSKGAALKVKEKGNRTKCSARFTYSVQSPRDVSTGQASGKRSSTTTTGETNIVSPRDAASGLPTGKRQHKPVTLNMIIDNSSPKMTGVADLDTDGRLDVVVAWKWTDGGVMAEDDWESPSN